MRQNKGYIHEAHNYDNGLKLATIKSVAPAVFSTQKDPDRSTSFGHVGTWELFSPMRDLNYVPVQVMQSGSRKPNGMQYARNLIRFRQVADLGSKLAEIFEIVVVNADNGTAAFKFLPGYLRSICMNGCIFGTFMYSLSIQHRRGWLDDAVEQVTNLTRQSYSIMEVIDDYKAIELDPEGQLQLAEYAHSIRFAGREVPFTAQDLLTPHDRAPQDSTLFSVMQDIQFWMVNGTLTAQAEGKRVSAMRPVHSVRDSVRYNTAIADAAEIVRRKTLGLPLVVASTLTVS